MLVPAQVFPIAKLCDTASTRYALGGVRLERDDDGAPHAIATDGRAMAHVTWVEPTPEAELAPSQGLDVFNTIVPLDAWKEGEAFEGFALCLANLRRAMVG